MEQKKALASDIRKEVNVKIWKTQKGVSHISDIPETITTTTFFEEIKN